MPQHFTANELRNWADQCRESAEDRNFSDPDRENFRKSERELNKLADDADAETDDGLCIEFILPKGPQLLDD